MKDRVKNVFKGQLFTSLIYLLLGACLVLFPGESVNIICKVIFGVVLMLAGLYHIWIYMSEDESSTIFNLFTGAILLVLGVFFFQNPQIVKMILPSLLAALLLVDSIWTLRAGLRLKRYNRNEWQFFVIVSLIFVTLGIVLFINPFVDMKYTILYAGVSFILDAVLDFVSMILAFKGNRAIERGEFSTEKKEKNELTEVNQKERKRLFDLFKRRDAEIVVSKDTDTKVAAEIMPEISDVKSQESDALLVSMDSKVKKKKFEKNLFGRFRKVKKNEERKTNAQENSVEIDGKSNYEQYKEDLEEDSETAQKILDLKEEPDKVQEVFELKEEPDKVQDIFKLEEEPDKIQAILGYKDEKEYIQDLLRIDDNVLED